VWKALVKELKMVEKIMPRDVRTRWNSMFAMLDFAVRYREALIRMTAERANNLREFELRSNEWKLVIQLHDGLKVRLRVVGCPFPFHAHLEALLSDLPQRNIVLFKRNTDAGHGYPRHGPYRPSSGIAITQSII
jgi:hypothetical protein